MFTWSIKEKDCSHGPKNEKIFLFSVVYQSTCQSKLARFLMWLISAFVD